jgi:hypothetical protein
MHALQIEKASRTKLGGGLAATRQRAASRADARDAVAGPAGGGACGHQVSPAGVPRAAAAAGRALIRGRHAPRWTDQPVALLSCPASACLGRGETRFSLVCRSCPASLTHWVAESYVFVKSDCSLAADWGTAVARDRSCRDAYSTWKPHRHVFLRVVAE